MKALLLFILLPAFFLSASMQQHMPKRSFITTRTGSLTAVYYPLGGNICRAVNRDHLRHNIKCSVMSTGGSIFNINALRDQSNGISITQGDWMYYAYTGQGVFENFGPMTELRYLFSLHTEAFTIVAREDAMINTLDDIIGKRVNIGVPGSGVRSTMELLMEIKGWDKSDFLFALERKMSEQAEALCNNEIDVAVFMNGHPSGAIQEAASTCNVNIIPILESDVPEIFDSSVYPFYVKSHIPGGLYSGAPDDVHTFGTKAIVVSTSSVPEFVIFEIMKSVFGDFDAFRSSYTVLNLLEIDDMMGDTYGGIPMHSGALRYYMSMQH